MMESIVDLRVWALIVTKWARDLERLHRDAIARKQNLASGCKYNQKDIK